MCVSIYRYKHSQSDKKHTCILARMCHGQNPTLGMLIKPFLGISISLIRIPIMGCMTITHIPKHTYVYPGKQTSMNQYIMNV